ncbi:hypothetical protein [Haloarchaeobius sp. HME9146]|uniref:hypothetical protein n=1 Tax=Haloarchaeobius sp. HME9146 TaxID=2978732 RepID=UPI0021BE5A22|nr:hypothetical protein [Haloarchaeobius sp. HME9146]MCT9097289.1 hypothetical protein [Haloarchaeobius sp. HME9146]
MKRIGRRGVLAGAVAMAASLASRRSAPPDRRQELVEQYHRGQENVVASSQQLTRGRQLLAGGADADLAGAVFTNARLTAQLAADAFYDVSAMAAGLGYERVVRDAEVGNAFATSLVTCSDAWYDRSRYGGADPDCPDLDWAGLTDVTDVRTAVGL